MVYSFLSATLAAIAAALPLTSPAVKQADPPPPDDFFPYISAPAMTAQASAPITLTVKYRTPGHPNPADASPYTITGKDMDTWKNPSSSQTLEVADHMGCSKETEQYPVRSDPAFRGTSPDNISTWDVVVSGLSVIDPGSNARRTIPEQVYVNKYLVANVALKGEIRDGQKQNDAPIEVSQTIIRPAYDVLDFQDGSAN